MSEKTKIELQRQALNELRELKDAEPFKPAADIDVVWVLSAPGTYKEVSHDGIYNGVSADKKNIDYGILLVKEITALRLGKDTNEVTKEDIAKAGPILYYNGEDNATAQTNYPQNQHLLEAAQASIFPLPLSKLIIGHIEVANTPSQVTDFVEYSRRLPQGTKVAVVSLIQHSVRVGRYLKMHEAEIPNIILQNAPTPETDKTVGKTLREVRKVGEYGVKGDLAEDNYWPSAVS